MNFWLFALNIVLLVIVVASIITLRIRHSRLDQKELGLLQLQRNFEKERAVYMEEARRFERVTQQ